MRTGIAGAREPTEAISELQAFCFIGAEDSIIQAKIVPVLYGVTAFK